MASTNYVDCTLTVLTVGTLGPAIGAIPAFHNGGTLILFRYSRHEDAKVTRLTHTLASLAASALITAPAFAQLILEELGWRYTFNGIRQPGVFVPAASKGVIRKEAADFIMASIKGVIDSLALQPMTFNIIDFPGMGVNAQIVIAPTILGQVLDDAGVNATEIQFP